MWFKRNRKSAQLPHNFYFLSNLMIAKQHSDAVIISLSSRATSFRDHNLNFLYVFMLFFAVIVVHLLYWRCSRSTTATTEKQTPHTKKKTLAHSLKYVSHDLNICSAASAINFLLAAHCFLECIFFPLHQRAASVCVCYVATWKVQVKNCIVNNNERKEKRRIENWTASRESKIKDASKETFWCAFFCVCWHIASE